jgi:predicted metal-dependent hydrolase
MFTGEYFEAHESFEDAWRAAAPAEKDFFQGLVHVTVAWYQAGRGNRVGCERQLAKAKRRLAAFTPGYREVDVAALLSSVAAAEIVVEGGSLELAPLERPEADQFEQAVHPHAEPGVAVEEQQQTEDDQ